MSEKEIIMEEKKNKRMARDLREILTELGRITNGGYGILDMSDNEIELYAELSDNQFKKLRDWLRSNRFVEFNIGNAALSYHKDYEIFYNKVKYTKIDNDGNYTDNSLILEYYIIESHDKKYYILQKIYFKGRK